MSDISVDKGTFAKQVDLALGTAINSATTIDLGASDGNTVIIVGTTTITGLGTPPQIGVKRTVKFSDALILTHSVNLVLFGNANITTVANDFAEFTATSLTVWEMTGFFRQIGSTNGQTNPDGLLNGAVTSLKLGDGAVIPSKTRPKYLTGLADANGTLTDGEMLDGLFIIGATASRNLTTATAVAIIATLPNYQVGTTYEITIINTGTFNAVLVGGTGVSIVGSATVNNQSGTFLVRVETPTTVSIYRK